MMKCPACNHENPYVVNFCGKCGSPLNPGPAGDLSRGDSKTLPLNQIPLQGPFDGQNPSLDPMTMRAEDMGMPVFPLNPQNRLQNAPQSPPKNNKVLGGAAILGIAIIVGLGGWLIGHGLKSPSKTDEQPLAVQLKESGPISETPNSSPVSLQIDSQLIGQDRTVVNQSLSYYSWDQVSASSTLAPDGRLRYDPLLVVDGDINTAWVEGRSDAGINEWVRLDTRQSRTVNRIEIKNGYAASERLFLANNRPSKLKLEFSDGAILNVDLKDGYGAENIIQLPKPVTTSSIKFTILDVYAGNKYNDTCIAEIRVY